jgi:hypothetical protein
VRAWVVFSPRKAWASARGTAGDGAEGVVGGGAAFAGVGGDERGSLMGPESASSGGWASAPGEDAGETGLESGMGKRPVRMVKGSEDDRKEDAPTGEGNEGEELREARERAPMGGRAHDDGRTAHNGR